MRKYLLAALMGLLIGTVALAADVRRLISVGDINFGSGTFTDTAGLTLYKVNADNVPFADDNSVKVGDLYELVAVKNYLLNVSSDVQTQIEAKLTSGDISAPQAFRDDVYLKFGTDNDFRLYYKAADGTLTVALDNGDAMCTFSKTGGLTCTGEIVAASFATTGADGERYVDASNSTAPTPAENSYPIYYDTVMQKIRVWNGTSWDNVALE